MASGKSVLEHTGGFVNKYYIHWTANGVTQSWAKNGCGFTAPFKTEICIDNSDDGVYIHSQGCAGLAWEWWSVNFKKIIVLSPTL